MKVIDLRSDTVTKPSRAMLEFMMNAEVGDDVYGEDPTVNKLEEMMAKKAEKEAAVFASSGTQSNLIALMAHCERGDEYIVGQIAHTYMWEGGGGAVLGSIQPQPIEVEKDGTLPLDKIESVIKPIDDHHPRTRLLCLENTIHGKVLPLNYLSQVSKFCKQQGLATHLDGARVFNATVKLGIKLNEISQYFDSISICLSKGLGAPVGSVLCGSKEIIKKARRWRKVVGGGMRQAGVIAAAGIYAIENNIDRLAEDHHNASYFAEKLSDLNEVEVDHDSLQTNIFYVRFKKNYPQLQSFLQTKGIEMRKQPTKEGKIRIVTHLDISKADIQKVMQEIEAFYKKSY